MIPEGTIVALATPAGESGLAVVRLSGPEAVRITGTIFRCDGFAGEVQTHHAYRGVVIWPGSSPPGHREAGAAIDEVVVLPMLAPASYTGEDVVEFFCHGGRMPARLVVEACLLCGARAAGPGEFTRRAFLNGKLSLDQAEAVADLIHAEDELAAAAALRQLQGGFDRELDAIEGPLRELLAELEGSLEFAEEERIEIPPARQVQVIKDALSRLEYLLDLAPAGRHLREGVQVILAGPPNVGKSSLLNALLGEERVLVDHEPGTTRDVVTGRRRRGGVLFVLHDTAGLRPDGGRVEKMGMELTEKACAEGDIVLLLQEAGLAGAGEDGMSAGWPESEGQTVFRVWTKVDLVPELNEEAGPGEATVTSAVTGFGIEELWDRILAAADRDRLKEVSSLGVLLNSRHQSKLIRCRERLADLVVDLNREAPGGSRGPGEEVVATLLAGILAELGEITGRVFSEGLLDEVFSRFCVGK